MENFVFPVKVYIEDTDFGGVVYHANYLKFFERARSEWLESLGYGIEWQKQQNIYFVVRSVNIDYLQPVRLNDRVEITSEIRSIKQVSAVFCQQLRMAGTTDTILCKAEVKVVCVNELLRPTAIPQELYAIIMGEQA
jgi:tol-pal system-associated acyl-CoA thioesterase